MSRYIEDPLIALTDTRGGRNDTDPPFSLAPNQVVEALNIDWKDSTLGRKRGGAASVSLTGGTSFASGMQSLFRHVPGSDETAAELWGIDGGGTPLVKRLTAGTSWANVTLDDAISTRPQDVSAATLNGKLFLAYDSPQDRLHVYDPKLTTPRVRRVGFVTPAVVTTANFGGGSYAAVSRYVRVRWVQLYGSTLIRRSEPGPSLLTTPSGSGAGLTITKPTAPGEGETHWEIEVSLDNATWYRIYGHGCDPSVSGVAIPIANTSRNDSIVTTSYGSLPASDPIGTYQAPLSAKYLLSDGNRLLMASGYESGVGLTTPAAPTLSKVAAGLSTPAVLHYFRIRWVKIVGGAVTKRSEASASASITPVAGDRITVTRPTAASEGETHWETEVSYDNITFRVYAGFGVNTTYGATSTIIGTTTTDFGSSAADVANLDTSAASTTYSTARNLSAVWYTPVLASADTGDDERVPETSSQKNRVYLNENDGGAITGLGGPLNGIPYAFKYRQVWKLRPTGDVAAPYLPRKVRDDAGCINHKTIAIGEDQIGRPALYYLSHRGPYRITFDGDVQYIGRDNEVTWRSMNIAASTTVAHSVYHPDLHQWWLWIATGSSNDPDVKMMFDVQNGFPDEHNQIRGGWAKHDGPSAGARCSCLFSNTLGASMSRDLKPHVGRATGTTILKCDTTDLDDASTAFQAYVKGKPLAGPPGRNLRIGEGYITAPAASATLTVSIVGNHGAASCTRTSTVSLAAAGTETRVDKKIEGLELAELHTAQITLGDASALAQTWALDRFVVPVKSEELR